MRCELQVFETDLGWMAGISNFSPQRQPQLVQLVVGVGTAEAALQAIHATIEDKQPTKSLDLGDRFDVGGRRDQASAWWSGLRRRLREYAAGADVCFDDIVVDLASATPFQARVLACCRQIRRGSTMSYAQLASAAGRPAAARAVGNVMARNRCPLVIPCHRVLHAGGGLGGFSAPQGVALKRRLLEIERIVELAGCPA